MNDIFFKILPFLKGRMSERTSLLFSGFAILALIFWGLSKTLPPSFEASTNTLYYLFLVSLSLVPISFIASWIFEIKHAWDMRMVVVDDIDPRLSSLPQNAIYAKKQGFKFRKPTKEEKGKWIKKRKLSTRIKELMFITQGDLKEKKIEENLYDPDTPISEFIKIRNERENID